MIIIRGSHLKELPFNSRSLLISINMLKNSHEFHLVSYVYSDKTCMVKIGSVKNGQNNTIKVELLISNLLCDIFSMYKIFPLLNGSNNFQSSYKHQMRWLTWQWNIEIEGNLINNSFKGKKKRVRDPIHEVVMERCPWQNMGRKRW